MASKAEKSRNLLLSKLKIYKGKVLEETVAPTQKGISEILLSVPFNFILDLLRDETISIPEYQRFDCWKISHRLTYLKDVYGYALENEFMNKPQIGISIREDDGSIVIWDGLHNSRSLFIYMREELDFIDKESEIEDSKYRDKGIPLWEKLSKAQQNKIISIPIRVQILMNSTEELEAIEYIRRNSGTAASVWDIEWAKNYAYQKAVDTILHTHSCFTSNKKAFGSNKDRKVSGIIATMLAVIDPAISLKERNTTVAIKALEKYYKDSPPPKHVIQKEEKFFSFCSNIHDRGAKDFCKADSLYVLYPLFLESFKYKNKKAFTEKVFQWYDQEYNNFKKLPSVLKYGLSKGRPGVGTGVKYKAYVDLVLKEFKKFMAK
jgi:hypothetical protein